MEHYVIIGNGTAAVSCIEGIRSIDGESPIAVISGVGFSSLDSSNRMRPFQSSESGNR